MRESSNTTADLAVTGLQHRGEPRVIREFTSIFLVSKSGDLWRVYDCASPSGIDRTMPSPDTGLPFRLFLALAAKTELRVHSFKGNASRETSAASLQAQLDKSALV